MSIKRYGLVELDTIAPLEGGDYVLHADYIELLEVLKDMLSGWRYIRETYGDLYGVGWDRCEKSAKAAITKSTS